MAPGVPGKMRALSWSGDIVFGKLFRNYLNNQRLSSYFCDAVVGWRLALAIHGATIQACRRLFLERAIRHDDGNFLKNDFRAEQ